MSSRLSVSHSTSTAPRNLATKECINRYYSTNSFKRGRRSFSPREHVNWEGGGSTNLLTRRNDHIPLPGATDRNIPWHARFSLKSTRRQTVFLLHRSCLCLVPHQNLKKTNHRNTFLKRRAKEWVKVVCETRKRAHSQQTPLCTRVAQLQLAPSVLLSLKRQLFRLTLSNLSLPLHQQDKKLYKIAITQRFNPQ